MGDNAPTDPTVVPARPFPVPTTFGGVAALAQAPAHWLGCWQILLALGTSLVVGWALDATWVRALEHAADALPESGWIRDGRLEWEGRAASILVQGPFLGVVVDPAGSRGSGLTSDVTVSIEQDRIAVRSILGWAEFPYPPELHVGLGRLDMTGTLAAWTQPALMGVAVAVFFGLLVSWLLLGAVYGLVVWAVGGSLGRMPSLVVAWRLAAGALLLPAILMAAAIVLYVTRDIGLAGLLVAVPVHIVAGWIYCIGAVTRLTPPHANPFRSGPVPAGRGAAGVGDPDKPPLDSPDRFDAA